MSRPRLEYSRARTAPTRLEIELRDAMDNGELELHYEPILALLPGRIVGFEALLHWRHAERGLLPASAFMPAAEASGLIVPIGDWALREALAEAADWPADLRLTLRLSGSQVRRGLFTVTALNAIADSGLAPARVEFSVTEGDLAGAGRGLETLRLLRRLGVHITLADYAGDPAHLGEPHTLPFDRLQLDMRRALDADGLSLATAIADFAAHLAVPVTATGLTTASQLRTARAAGVAEVQGPLLSPLFEPRALHRLLDTHYDRMPEPPLDPAG